MIATLQTQRVRTLEPVCRVGAGEEPVEFEVLERASAYDIIRRTLVQFDYAALGNADKGALRPVRAYRPRPVAGVIPGISMNSIGDARTLPVPEAPIPLTASATPCRRARR